MNQRPRSTPTSDRFAGTPYEEWYLLDMRPLSEQTFIAELPRAEAEDDVTAMREDILNARDWPNPMRFPHFMHRVAEMQDYREVEHMRLPTGAATHFAPINGRAFFLANDTRIFHVERTPESWKIEAATFEAPDRIYSIRPLRPDMVLCCSSEEPLFEYHRRSAGKWEGHVVGKCDDAFSKGIAKSLPRNCQPSDFLPISEDESAFVALTSPDKFVVVSPHVGGALASGESSGAKLNLSSVSPNSFIYWDDWNSADFLFYSFDNVAHDLHSETIDRSLFDNTHTYLSSCGASSLAVGHDNGTVRHLWRDPNGNWSQAVAYCHRAPITAVQMLPNRGIVSASRDGTIVMHRPREASWESEVLKVGSANAFATSLQVYPNGMILAACTDEQLRVYKGDPKR